MKNAFGTAFRIYFLMDELGEGRDPADLTKDEMTSDILPIIQKIQENTGKGVV
jgi:hypothetical protein